MSAQQEAEELREQLKEQEQRHRRELELAIQARKEQPREFKMFRGVLGPVINEARKIATDPDDYQSVWNALVKIASNNNRPAPLLGAAVGQAGIPYKKSSGEKEYFTINALRMRLTRSSAQKRK